MAKRKDTATTTLTEGRSGTLEHAYERKDGTKTRSTTIHLPEAMHQKLRVAAAKRSEHMSAIVAEALAQWFKDN